MKSKEWKVLESRILDARGRWLNSSPPDLSEKERENLYAEYLRRRIPFPAYLVSDWSHLHAMGYLYRKTLTSGLEVVHNSEQSSFVGN